MPSSIGHYAMAYLIRRLRGNLVLPGLIISSVVPDLSFLVNLLSPRVPGIEKRLLHSLLGVVTLGTLISVMPVLSLYPFSPWFCPQFWLWS